MYFDQAQEEMSNGNKVKLSDWTGYWFNDNGQIKVFTKDGDVLDTPHIDRYKDRDDWEVTDGRMGFDFALLALNNGKKLQREGWNGKGQFIVVMPPLYLHPYMDCQPYFAIYNAQNKWQPGWLPSQGDLFAKDWQIVD